MNNLYTLSYFRKRLLEAGITSKILIKDYPDADPRYWTVSIFGDKHIMCTCIKERNDIKFEFWDYGVHIGNNRVIKTKSMNVIISSLFQWTAPSFIEE